ncbi:MAG TPA: pyridoxamine 5'-phosphate oxidase [Terracidiphilus sp.]|jgi:pyridoxamine 5'-phosphate oxidase
MSLSHEMDSEDPLELFVAWLKQAQESEPSDPNAAALATSTPDGRPSVRMVLAKNIGGHPFCFFTNAESRKGIELAVNPQAALCFHWKSLRRQVRVEGIVSELEASDVDHYFHSRSRASQIGAAISNQSRVLPSREELEARVRQFSQQNPGVIPRPAFWRGFRLSAERIEFWLDGANRLHDRLLFTRDGARWQKARLYP